ncbi:hypothetical protein BDP27DRAFT_1316654, partial [Rhodocollybia butyracea]
MSAFLEAFPHSLIIPGLTARDIRFALLVDQMFREQFRPSFSTSTEFSSTGIQSFIHHPDENPFVYKPSIRAVFQHGFCTCCGLNHPLSDCPVRKEYPPIEGKCKICQGIGHWDLDCVKQQTLFNET